MDDQELAALLVDLESDRVERKASISDGKKYDRQFVLLLTTYQTTKSLEFFLWE